MTANRIRVLSRNQQNFKKGTSLRFNPKTDILFSVKNGLVYSNYVKDFKITNKYLIFMSFNKISIYDRNTNEKIALLNSPAPHIRFNDIDTSSSQIYIATNNGIYTYSLGLLGGNGDLQVLRHKFDPEYLGGSNVVSIYFRTVFGVDYLAASHENGFVLVHNDGQFKSFFAKSDSNPGKVYITGEGEIYYQNGTYGMYYIANIPAAGNITLYIPSHDYLYSSVLPSKDFKALYIFENTVSDVKNTLFMATASGVTVLTESIVDFSLASLKNISIQNIKDIYVEPGATSTSGTFYFTVSTTSGTGYFAEYNLATDSILNQVTSTTDAIFDSNMFTRIDEF